MPFQVSPRCGRRHWPRLRPPGWSLGGNALALALRAGLLLAAGLVTAAGLLPSPAALANPQAGTSPTTSNSSAPPSRPIQAAGGTTSGAPQPAANRNANTKPSPNQPYAIDKGGLLPPPCPLIVSPELPALQPIRILPSQVAAKNRMGCLSAADAIYGPDGCPLRLCAANSGAFPGGEPR